MQQVSALQGGERGEGGHEGGEGGDNLLAQIQTTVAVRAKKRAWQRCCRKSSLMQHADPFRLQ